MTTTPKSQGAAIDQAGAPAEQIARVILHLIGEGAMDWKAAPGLDPDDAFNSDTEELNILADLVNKALAAPAGAQKASEALRDVLAERRRQVEVEGWTPEHDDMHGDGQMAVAAGYYALACGYPHERVIGRRDIVPNYWPWAPSWWKPSTARRNLIKAGALILAEIERLDRASQANKAGLDGGANHG